MQGTVSQNLPTLFSEVSTAEQEQSEQGKGREPGRTSYDTDSAVSPDLRQNA